MADEEINNIADTNPVTDANPATATTASPGDVPAPNRPSRILRTLLKSPEERRAEREQKQKAKLAKKASRLALKQAGKAVAAEGATAAAAATAPIWGPIVAVILGIGLAILIIAMFVGVGDSGQFGSRFHRDSDQNQELTALAYAGDVLARRELDAKDIPKVLTALTKVEQKAKEKNDTDSIHAIATIRSKLSTYSSTDGKVDKSTLRDVQSLLLQLANKGYGGVGPSALGIKIAEIAHFYAGTTEGLQKYLQCPIEDKTACNSFAIKVVHEAGADPNYSGRAFDQYEYTKAHPECYETFTVTNTLTLAPGDILFRPFKKRGYGHVAIYIGNGKIASASIGGHTPRIGKWYGEMSAVARVKGDGCKSAS